MLNSPFPSNCTTSNLADANSLLRVLHKQESKINIAQTATYEKSSITNHSSKLSSTWFFSSINHGQGACRANTDKEHNVRDNKSMFPEISLAISSRYIPTPNFYLEFPRPHLSYWKKLISKGSRRMVNQEKNQETIIFEKYFTKIKGSCLMSL